MTTRMAPAFKSRKVIVTGSRAWKDPQPVRDALDKQLSQCDLLVVVHGGCPTGVDSIAAQWVKDNPNRSIEFEYKADWKSYGKAAGPLRNRMMIESNRWAVACLAFPIGASRGTRNCMKLAAEAGIPVIEFSP